MTTSLADVFKTLAAVFAALAVAFSYQAPGGATDPTKDVAAIADGTGQTGSGQSNNTEVGCLGNQTGEQPAPETVVPSETAPLATGETAPADTVANTSTPAAIEPGAVTGTTPVTEPTTRPGTSSVDGNCPPASDPAAGGVPLRELISPTGGRLYTLDDAEVKAAATHNLKVEPAALGLVNAKSFGYDAAPIYRFRNDELNTWFFTTETKERDAYSTKNGWKLERITGYVHKKAGQGLTKLARFNKGTEWRLAPEAKTAQLESEGYTAEKDHPLGYFVADNPVPLPTPVNPTTQPTTPVPTTKPNATPAPHTAPAPTAAPTDTPAWKPGDKPTLANKAARQAACEKGIKDERKHWEWRGGGKDDVGKCADLDKEKPSVTPTPKPTAAPTAKPSGPDHAATEAHIKIRLRDEYLKVVREYCRFKLFTMYEEHAGGDPAKGPIFSKHSYPIPCIASKDDDPVNPASRNNKDWKTSFAYQRVVDLSEKLDIIGLENLVHGYRNEVRSNALEEKGHGRHKFPDDGQPLRGGSDGSVGTGKCEPGSGQKNAVLEMKASLGEPNADQCGREFWRGITWDAARAPLLNEEPLYTNHVFEKLRDEKLPNSQSTIGEALAAKLGAPAKAPANAGCTQAGQTLPGFACG